MRLSVKKGSFITVNYVCKVKETDELVDSTVEVEGYSHGEEEEHEHEPLLVVVGEGWIPRGLDEALENAEVGRKFEVEIPPDKGYGDRDQSKVRLLPLRRFTREGVNPAPGMRVQVDGRSATVRAVGAGRVQVDFNHPLAGKTLIYDITVEKVLRTKSEKVKASIHKRMPTVDLEKVGLMVSQKEVTVELPEEAFFIEGLQMAKRQIASEIQKYIQGITEVTFIERFKMPEEAFEPSQKPASPAQDSQ